MILSKSILIKTTEPKEIKFNVKNSGNQRI